MSVDQVLELLDSLNFFSELTKEEKAEIARLETQIVQYQTNQPIIREGETDQAVYLILKGYAVTTSNQSPNYEISRLQPGSVCGEMSMLLNRPRCSNVIVKSDYLIALKIDGNLFNKLQPGTLLKIKDQFLKVLALRIDAMNGQVLQLVREVKAVQNQHADISHALTDLSRDAGNIGRDLERIRKNMDRILS